MARGKDIRRLEFTQFVVGDEVLAELEAEATARGVSVQRHIYDLLRARYLARRGQALRDLLWIPGEVAPAVEEEAPVSSAASSAAAAWLDLQDD